MGDNKISEAVELLPCPFCGGTDIDETHVRTYSLDSSYDVFGFLSCGANFEDGTPADWNQRAAIPHLQGEAVPVGYRWRHSAGEQWQYSDIPCGWEHEPLYLHPQPAALNEVSGNSGELGGEYAGDTLNKLRILLGHMCDSSIFQPPNDYNLGFDAGCRMVREQAALAATGKQPLQVGEVQGVNLGPIATRKLGELAAQGYITNGVAIFNPATGQRGLVDNLGFVGWMGAQGANDRESCSNCDNGIAINSNFRTEEACRHCQTSQLTKVAEVVKNTAGQVYIEWIVGMVVDHVGSSLYKFNGSKE